MEGFAKRNSGDYCLDSPEATTQRAGFEHPGDEATNI